MNIYVGGCAKTVTMESLKDFCENHLKIDVKECEPLNSRSTETQSFRIKVDVLTRDNIIKSELWPEDVYLRKYYQPRRQNNLAQNG